MSKRIYYQVAEMTPEWWAAVEEILKPSTRKAGLWCSRCGRKARPAWKYCPDCGKKLPIEKGESNVRAK